MTTPEPESPGAAWLAASSRECEGSGAVPIAGFGIGWLPEIDQQMVRMNLDPRHVGGHEFAEI
jgi:hypothetical protein